MLLSAWTDDWVSIPVDEEFYYEKLQERIATSFRQAAVGTRLALPAPDR